MQRGFSERVLAGLLGPEGASARVLILAAHPDDEAIGAGGLLKHLKDAWFAHLTDGAPRSRMAARSRGFASAAEYALARRAELAEALCAMRSAPGGLFEIGAADLAASFSLVLITRLLADIIRSSRPAVVMTHPYEGGHPDHDSAAFAASSAIRLIARAGEEPPRLVEFTSYHASPTGSMETSAFLPGNGPETAIELSEGERVFKERMFRCYATQKGALCGFPIAVERFRPAPEYAFTAPPHEGRLFYQRFDWGLPGNAWCHLAARALSELGLSPEKEARRGSFCGFLRARIGL